MGIFSRKQQSEDLPELIEEGDPLIGKHARDNEGHDGTIDAVYRFSDGSKRVDIRDTRGLASSALAPDEYSVEETYYCGLCRCQMPMSHFPH